MLLWDRQTVLVEIRRQFGYPDNELKDLRFFKDASNCLHPNNLELTSKILIIILGSCTCTFKTWIRDPENKVRCKCDMRRFRIVNSLNLMKLNLTRRYHVVQNAIEMLFEVVCIDSDLIMSRIICHSCDLVDVKESILSEKQYQVPWKVQSLCRL